jgi:hypothetical protein
MARLSDHLDAHKRTHTHGLNATAQDIRRGKTAYAGGQRLIGQADILPIQEPASNETILLIQNPLGLSSGSYNPVDVANGGVLIKSSTLKGLSASNISINTNGYVYTAVNYLNFLVWTAAKRVTSYARKYEMWGMTKTGALTTNEGVRIWVNCSPTQNQAWVVELYWTGSAFKVDLTEWTSPTSTNRGTFTLSTNVDDPLVWHLVVYTIGDRIWIALHSYESDGAVLSDAGAYTFTYTVANRLYKDYTGGAFGVRLTPGDEWLMRGFSVMDVG